jgi:membrane protease YdiL (CAAX protease family)
VVYELLSLGRAHSHRSVVWYLVEELLRNGLQSAGGVSVLLLNALMIGVFALVGVLGIRWSGQKLQPLYLPVMLAEGGVLAILLALALNAVPRLMVVPPEGLFNVTTKLATAIGAGVYEEFVFRVVLLGGLVVLFSRGRRFPPWAAYMLALVISSIAFAVAHYFSMGRAPFDRHVFILRQLAGVVFGIIYCLRGFGVAAYAHTMYDLFVLFT